MRVSQCDYACIWHDIIHGQSWSAMFAKLTYNTYAYGDIARCASACLGLPSTDHCHDTKHGDACAGEQGVLILHDKQHAPAIIRHLTISRIVYAGLAVCGGVASLGLKSSTGWDLVEHCFRWVFEQSKHVLVLCKDAKRLSMAHERAA
jgi:hypothetical protein